MMLMKRLRIMKSVWMKNYVKKGQMFFIAIQMANARWVATVLQTTIQSNPTIEVKTLRNEWQINGIPCMHVVAVFIYNRQFAHEHVHWYYSKEAMKLTYSRSINPIPDESRWPEIEHDDGNANGVVEPPQKRTKVGRPKKARRRAADEPRAPTKIFSNKCKGCNTIGHNIRNVKGKGKRPSSKGKKGSSSHDTTTAALTFRSHSHQLSTSNVSQQQSQTTHLSSIPIAPPTHVPDVCSQIGSTSQP
ncbi:hypothetical protein ACOSQ3_027729 [Xanthoceras sorbifolium]